MNSINLVGRITKELELKYTPTTNTPMCEFGLAVNRVGQEQADFINCQVWGTQAENLAKYQGKGSLVGVVGSLRTDTYEVEGNKRYKTYVLVNNVEYLGTKKETQSDTQNDTQVDPFADFGQEVSIDDNDFLD
jgi:single-strand DNA-binding protein